MERTRVNYDYQLTKTLALLRNPGLLLASTKANGQSNVMTIGWGSVGVMWARPVFVVMVRPSRYTYEFIEESQAFTVNVPSEAMRSFVGVCGTRSGRDLDKFAAYHVATTPGQMVPAVTIDDCPMVYECRVAHFNDLIPANLRRDIEEASYGGRDYHRFYYGEILGAYAAADY
ncbi:MAG: flavin reductase family protein [Chloroflexi bacterium]|nr:flavin reductase family protein [Chloroflexota bacterium]